MYKDKRVIFMGTPIFAVPILEYLINEVNVVLVISQPDREKNRKKELLPTPIKKLAYENKINVFQPTNIKECVDDILKYKPDLIITCAYGQIVPEAILNYPEYGCINIHGSLLPKLRGGAPIHHAIINGDKKTGITIMYMDKKMDSGDIISQREIDIKDDDILDTLYEKMAYLGRDLLKDTLCSIFNKTNNRIKQKEEEVTFGFNITKDEEKINFNDNALNINNLIRGLNSIPGAYCMLDDKRLKIYSIEILNNKSNMEPGTIKEFNNNFVVCTKDFDIKILDLKIEGKKRCFVKEYLNGIINKDEYVGKVLR